MTLRTSLLNDVKNLSQDELQKAYQFIEKLKKDTKKPLKPLDCAGSISDADAEEIKSIISKEFSAIEGEW